MIDQRQRKDRQQAVRTIMTFHSELVRLGLMSPQSTLSPRGALEWLKDERVRVFQDAKRDIRKAVELLT